MIDPRPSPDGRRIAYVAGGRLRVVGADGGGDRDVAAPESPTVTYGLAEEQVAENLLLLQAAFLRRTLRPDDRR